MKHFWKTTNRGLLLGALLLVVLFGVIVINEVVFWTEKPEIRETVEDYVSDLMAFNITPEDVELGKTLTAAQKAERQAALEDLFRRYWDAERSTDEYGNVDAVRENYSTLLEDPVRVLFKDTAIAEIGKQDITIKANGPGYAKVDVTLLASAEFIGAEETPFVGELLWYEPLTEEEILLHYDPTQRYSATYTIEMGLELHRTSDGWRILSYDHVWVNLDTIVEMGGEG